MSKSPVLILLLAILCSCAEDRLYEAKNDFDNGSWHVDDQIQFEFDIESNAISYNLSLSLRHTLDYPFHNLYYQYQLIDQDENIVTERLVNLELFNPKSGRPIGSGIGVYRDLETLVEENLSFSTTGRYKISLKHYMRPEVLQGIISVGIKVKKNQ